MVKQFIHHYIWFWKESFSFCKGDSKLYIIRGCLKMAHKHAISMVRWERLTPEQREAWYLSSEGRVLEF